MEEWHMSCAVLGKWLLAWHPWLLWPRFHPQAKKKKNLKFCQEMNRMCFSLLNPNSFANDISFVSLEELLKSMTTCMNNFVVILDIIWLKPLVVMDE
jgi:hypothetical protein